MKILLVSQYANPNLIGGNNNVFKQAFSLKNDHAVDIEVLTWPCGDGWTNFESKHQPGISILNKEWFYESVKYYIASLPLAFISRVLPDTIWQNAVNVGCTILKTINPDIVHLHHWRGLWWMLASAHHLGIPTVFTSHDWGPGCLRTILLQSNGNLCDGVVEKEKCAFCILKGRNLVGKVNEALINTRYGLEMVNLMMRTPLMPFLLKRGMVQTNVHNRVMLHLARTKRILEKCNHIIVPGAFAKSFYVGLGASPESIHVQPWYCEPYPDQTNIPPPIGDRITLGYIGRISPDKGLDSVFLALSKTKTQKPFHFKIAGAVNNAYAKQLQKKYHHQAGMHSIEWLGWIPREQTREFYISISLVLICSQWMDNTPLTLIEAFAHQRPVVMPDIPSTSDLLINMKTGFTYPFGSTARISDILRHVAANPEVLAQMQVNLPKIHTLSEYTASLKMLYSRCT